MAALVSLCGVAAASAATLHVTSGLDNGSAGTLRSVIASAVSGDTVVIDPGVDPHLSSQFGSITISAATMISLTIEGQGARATTITGDGVAQIFVLSNRSCGCTTPAVTFSGVTLTGGRGTNGGAVLVGFNSGATLTGVTLSGNVVTNGDPSADGGAVDDEGGLLTLNGVTAVGNSAETDGGAIYVNGGSAQINNSTITGNTAGVDGGGVYNQGQATLVGDTLAGNRTVNGAGGNIQTNGTVTTGTTTLKDTIVSGGIAPPGSAAGSNCSGPFISGGHNLESTNQCGLTGIGDQVGVDPLLGPLGNNGGPTDTMALPSGSPAIGRGNCADFSPALDQRGLPRPGFGETGCDTGAYEFQLRPTAVAVTCTPSPAGFGVPTTCSATVTDQAGADAAPPSGTVTFSTTAGSFGATSTCMLSGAGATAGCSVPLTPNALGSQQVSAAYGGDTLRAASTGSTPLSVIPGPPVSITVHCAPGTVAPGASTTCTATVGAVTGGSPARPTGSVAFTVHGASKVRGGGMCTLPAAGTPAACAVTYTLGSRAKGTYDVTAAYQGDALHLPASVPTSFAATPVAGEAANAEVVSGTVLIELPSGHSFSPLIDRRGSPVPGVVSPLKGATVAVPMGSTVDTTKGKVALATAASYGKHTGAAPALQNATLSASIFTIEQMTAKQARKHLKRGEHRLFGMPPTTLAMRTPRGATAKARCRRTAAPGKGVVRAISGTGKGLFRTVGANSITTIRNATWIVSDRCDGTLTEVGRGRATVAPIHPTHKHDRPVVITAGQGVLIKGRFR
jgi:hypothetical protein